MGYFEVRHFFKKNYSIYFLGIYWKIWLTFNSNILSRCSQTNKIVIEDST